MLPRGKVVSKGKFGSCLKRGPRFENSSQGLKGSRSRELKLKSLEGLKEEP